MNPLPLAKAGNNKAICFGSSASIGDTAVTGNTYSWTSNPSGFSDTTSNPTVNPTITTSYYLTEKIIATGCNKSDSVITSVNPLPLANASKNQAVCLGSGSVQIGDTAIAGNTYSWASSPSGLTDTSANPIVSPTTTTTYYLSELITATGCKKSDSVLITINALPYAKAGKSGAICFGGNTAIGDTAISGSAYSWSSGPAGFSDSNANLSVSPTITTTYFLTETITATGCRNSDSVVITVDSLPVVSAGANDTVFISKPSYLLTGFSPIGGKWSGKGVDTLGNFDATSAGLGIDSLKYTYTNANGCTAASVKTISVIIGGITVYDAGIDQILSPVGNMLPDNYPVIAHLLNFGSKSLKNVEVHWQVNNITQPVYYWTGALGKDSSNLIPLAPDFDFTKVGTYTIKAWTAGPDSEIDENHLNDTTQEILSIFYTSINQPSANSNGVKIWYNADDKKVYIQVSSISEKHVGLILTDAQGKILSNSDFTLQMGINQTTIDMSAYASGIYVCIVQGNTTIEHKKLMKAK